MRKFQCLLFVLKSSSNVNEVIRAVLNFLFFLQKEQSPHILRFVDMYALI